MVDLKAEAINFLFSRTDKDKSAARLLEECGVDVRLASNADPDERSVDVLLRAGHDLASELHKNDFAGRIENALREASPTPIRHLQWVETEEDVGPSAGNGVGDPSTDNLGHYHGREGERVRKSDPGRTGNYNTQRPGDAPVQRRNDPKPTRK